MDKEYVGDGVVCIETASTVMLSGFLIECLKENLPYVALALGLSNNDYVDILLENGNTDVFQRLEDSLIEGSVNCSNISRLVGFELEEQAAKLEEESDIPIFDGSDDEDEDEDGDLRYSCRVDVSGDEVSCRISVIDTVNGIALLHWTFEDNGDFSLHTGFGTIHTVRGCFSRCESLDFEPDLEPSDDLISFRSDEEIQILTLEALRFFPVSDKQTKRVRGAILKKLNSPWFFEVSQKNIDRYIAFFALSDAYLNWDEYAGIADSFKEVFLDSWQEREDFLGVDMRDYWRDIPQNFKNSLNEAGIYGDVCDLEAWIRKYMSEETKKVVIERPIGITCGFPLKGDLLASFSIDAEGRSCAFELINTETNELLVDFIVYGGVVQPSFANEKPDFSHLRTDAELKAQLTRLLEAFKPLVAGAGGNALTAYEKVLHQILHAPSLGLTSSTALSDVERTKPCGELVSVTD